MTTYKVIDKRNAYYDQAFPENPKFPRYHAPCGIWWVSLTVDEGRSQRFNLADLRECTPFMTRMEFTCELPPHMHDNILALTEVLNSRNPERQASRDLYKDWLQFEIEQAVA